MKNGTTMLKNSLTIYFCEYIFRKIIKCAHKELYTSIFIKAAFKIAKIWKQNMSNCLNKIRYISKIDYYVVTKSIFQRIFN